MSVSIKDNMNKFLAAVEAMQQGRVLVGIPMSEDKRQDSPIGNAAIGYINENGSPAQGIPPRPFLKPGVEKVKEQIANELKSGAAAAFDDPTSVQKSYTRAGLIAVGSIKKTIVAGEGFEPLADSTIEARRRAGAKGEKPLIRTGQLLNSITYVIRDH